MGDGDQSLTSKRISSEIDNNGFLRLVVAATRASFLVRRVGLVLTRFLGDSSPILSLVASVVARE